jgi:maltose O-acetyltransferase
MRTEKEKMLAGDLYNPLDKQLSDERLKTRLLLAELNNSREDKPEERARILKELIPRLENIYGCSHHFIVIMAVT